MGLWQFIRHGVRIKEKHQQWEAPHTHLFIHND